MKNIMFCDCKIFDNVGAPRHSLLSNVGFVFWVMVALDKAKLKFSRTDMLNNGATFRLQDYLIKMILAQERFSCTGAYQTRDSHRSPQAASSLPSPISPLIIIAS